VAFAVRDRDQDMEEGGGELPGHEETITDLDASQTVIVTCSTGFPACDFQPVNQTSLISQQS
jgi:hypothetical protein